MKIPANRIEAFIAKECNALAGVLLYGPDAGLIAERAEDISKHIVTDIADPFRVVDIAPETLKEEPALLRDEIAAFTFGGGRKLIRIRGAGAGNSEAFEALGELGDAQISASFVLVTAGELAPSSTLRKLFETLPRVAAVPCYVDDAYSLRPIAGKALKDYRLTAEEGVIETIIDYCQGDRMIVRSALEKLSLYMGKETHVTVAHVSACIGETTESSLEDLCYAVADGNRKEVERHYRKSLLQGGNPIGALRTLTYYFLRLFTLSGAKQQGSSYEAAIANLRPPVFFKQKPLLLRHAERWGGEQTLLPRALSLLYETELACKHTGVPAETLCNRALLRLASMGRKI